MADQDQERLSSGRHVDPFEALEREWRMRANRAGTDDMADTLRECADALEARRKREAEREPDDATVHRYLNDATFHAIAQSAAHGLATGLTLEDYHAALSVARVLERRRQEFLARLTASCDDVTSRTEARRVDATRATFEQVQAGLSCEGCGARLTVDTGKCGAHWLCVQCKALGNTRGLDLEGIRAWYRANPDSYTPRDAAGFPRSGAL